MCSYNGQKQTLKRHANIQEHVALGKLYSLIRAFGDPRHIIQSFHGCLGNSWKYLFNILCKSIAGRYRPVRVADGPITARCRFIKNASWVIPQSAVDGPLYYCCCRGATVLIPQNRHEKPFATRSMLKIRSLSSLSRSLISVQRRYTYVIDSITLTFNVFN